MKSWMVIMVVLILTGLFSLPSYADTGWENCIWLSQDLEGRGKRTGFIHYDRFMIKNVSEVLEDGGYSFDISLSNTLVSFDRTSGLYGELGVQTNNNFNLFFGGGYNYQSSKMLLTIGSKYILQAQTLNTEAEAIITIFSPLVLDLNYDFNARAFFVGLGVTFQ